MKKKMELEFGVMFAHKYKLKLFLTFYERSKSEKNKNKFNIFSLYGQTP